jgi:uncharacterized protein YndB with AHSA1/START domain
MTDQEAPRVTSASREIAADAGTIFELIADPAQQPRWDGNDNLAAAAAGQRVRRAGDVFTMRITTGSIRENHVVEFDEGRLIAWMPAEVGRKRPGHLWRWELEPLGASRTRVAHVRLDPADGQEPLPAGPVDHRRPAQRLARPPRGPSRRHLTATSMT